MLNMLNMKQKKWLVDNQPLVTTVISSVVCGFVEAGVDAMCTIVFNDHKYEMKRIVRNESTEDFIIFEDVSRVNDIRDIIRPNCRADEKAALDEIYGDNSKTEKNKKKKNKKNK